MTQEEMVVDYLKSHGEISSVDAVSELGITQLGTRIFNLKKEGYVFGKRDHIVKNRTGRKVHFCTYYIIEEA